MKPACFPTTPTRLKNAWNNAVATLRSSSLRRFGNPLYVLPWYLIIGQSGTGKTTALTRALQGHACSLVDVSHRQVGFSIHGPHAEWLLQALFVRTDELDTQALAALRDGLARWLRACEQADFAQAVPLAALRHGWMDALQQPSLDQRFRAGGVTICWWR